MDPEIKKYFRKILYSFSFGLLWLFCNSTGGLYYKLGFMYEGIRWYNIAFYFFLTGSLFLLLRYYYRSWKDTVQ
ncbi:MAG: hypothetical protein ICV65_15330 [Flavisolibacter sp.]|nr:hypothetical protein [Flavisolibacter sp.]